MLPTQAVAFHIAAQRLGPVKQLVMSRVRRIAKLGVLAGGTLSSNRLEINRRKDGVLGLGTPGGSFLEQRYRGLTAARAMKDVNIQPRHDSSPVVEESIRLARKEARMESLFSFPVGLFHPLQHAGLSRRTLVCRRLESYPFRLNRTYRERD